MTIAKGLYDLLLSSDMREQLKPLQDRYAIETIEVKGPDRRRRLIADLSRRLADVLEQFD